VRTRCDGVPFYIEQVMNALVTGSDREGARVPEALYEPLFARLRTCANAIPVVRAAGVIGRNIDRGLLRTACTLRDDEIEAVARELEKAGVFEPWREDGWRFRHELLREVAEELVPPTVRRTLHGRVADALAAGGDPDWSLVATHCQEAERYDDAAYAHQQASVAARRRGALAEARHHLALALENLERLPAGTERDRREVVVRLERGLLTAAAEFYSSESVAADFERCLALGSADLADDESVATLLSLVSYYATRADLRRMADVLRLLHERLGDGREWFGPAIEASLGVLYWLRGEFSSAGHYFDKVTTVRRGAVQPIEAVWYLPNEPVASAYLHQALTRLIRGDLAGAEEQLAESLRRSTELGFPQGPFMGGYSRYIEGWIHLEASRFHEAAALATALDGYAEQHGFDQWRLVAATVQAAARAGLAMSAENPDEVAGALDQMTGVLDLWRAVGLDIYLTFFDAVVARLLIAAGELDRARTYLDNALRVTERTEMRFYAAELLRLRARTQRDTVARRADLTTAYETADAQGATLIQLRVALDQFSDTGDADRVADVLRRIPVGSCLPELARARRVVYSPRTRS
jgi:tetratricopeptide (TPR) repeat protein